MTNRRKLFFLFSLLLLNGFSIKIFSQRKILPHVEVVNTGVKTSLRGLSVVNNNVVWVSGSNGMVGKSSSGGKNWKWMSVKGFEKNDFRDIEAFDANTAIIMAIAEPAYILKTTDGGDTWKIVYENKTKGMFLDAMEFRDPMNGVVIGDPVDGRFFIARTSDLLQTAGRHFLLQVVQISAICIIKHWYSQAVVRTQGYFMIKQLSICQ